MKEVICITDQWEEFDPNFNTPSPKKGDIYTVCDMENIDGKDYIALSELGGNFYSSDGFRPIDYLNEQIKSALVAPNPDYKIHKLSPEERELVDMGYFPTDGRKVKF